MAKYSLPDFGTVMISGNTIDRLIEKGDGTAALVYLYILKSGGDVSADKISADMRMSRQDAERALYALGTMGIIQSDETKKQDVSGGYSIEQIANAMEKEDFSAVVSETERVFGEVLGSEELKRLYNIYDNIGLPPEVILQLVQFFKNDVRRRYGPGRRLSMAKLEKLAFEWSRNEINTLEAAETHIKKIELYYSHEGEMKRAIGVYDRKLIGNERTYIESWMDMGFGSDSVKIAYERTIDRIHALNFNYMDKIILSWHSKNLHTPEEIDAGDPYGKPGRKNGGAKSGVTKSTGFVPAKDSPSYEDTESVKRILEIMEEE